MNRIRERGDWTSASVISFQLPHIEKQEEYVCNRKQSRCDRFAKYYQNRVLAIPVSS